MNKRLTKTGNSLALVLDRAILELVRIDPEQPVEISTDDGHRLIITQNGQTPRRRKLKAALEKVNQVHGKTLKRLAE